MPAVGGFVFDSAGAPVDRELRIYRRDTGALLGKARSSGGNGDPHFDKVSLLLHMDGANGSTTFTDSSQTPNTITGFGSAKTSTAQSKFGGASALLGGASGYLYSNNIPALRLATGDFTIELFFLAAVQSGFCSLIGQRTGGGGGWGIFLDAVLKQVYIQGTTGTPSYVITANSSYVDGVWNHIAVVRAGATTKIYVNGSEKASGSIGWAEDTTAPFAIGYQHSTSQYPFLGYIDEVRITKDVARYTANFTPPTEPFLDMSGAGRTLAFGEYYFVTTHTGEVQVVCVDDASGPLENDLILRTFPV